MSDPIEMRLRKMALRGVRTKSAADKLMNEAADVIELMTDKAKQERADRLQSLSDQNRLTGGWRAVPEECTGPMMRAFWRAGPYPSKPFQAGWKAMLAASPPLPDTGGWRDIESAPKDGTLILLYGDTPDGPRVTAGNWLAPEHGDYLGDCGGECRCPEYGDPPEPLWWDTDGGFTDEWPPLGWQPLPSPPLPLPGGEEKR